MKRILTLSSNPKGTSVLDLDREIRDIREGLQRSQNREQFEIEQRGAVRVEDLRQGLLDVQPTIVHFCGHGTGERGLVLENDAGEPHLVSTEALSDLFAILAGQIECVLLNACYAEVQAKEIVRHVNYVIGMQDEIRDDLAIAFTQGFYDGLGAGQSIDVAYKLGCNAIQFEVSKKLTPERKLVPTGAPESTQKAEISEHLIPVLLKKEQLYPPSSASPAMTSQSAGKGLYALADLMADSEVNEAVKAGREKLQDACQQIEVVSTYKDLHDQLHTLEFQVYRTIIQEARNFPNSETALDNLTDYELTLQQITSNLREIAERQLLKSQETEWIKKLEQAGAELHAAIETLNLRQLQRAIWLLNQVLAIQPAIIDTSLKKTAEALPLAVLVQHMSKIRNGVVNVILASKESEKIRQFQEGVTALETMEQSLASLISSHYEWQTIDLELRRIEGTLEKDTFELEMSWPDLQMRLEAQCGNCEEDWAIALKQDREKLDKALKAQPPTPDLSRRFFRSYRRRASERFYRIDVDLKKFCGQLRAVSKPLALMVEKGL
jgi:CHAT domain